MGTTAPAPTESLTARVAGRARQELRYLAELAGPAAVGISQPVLGPFGQSPETFAAVGADGGEIVRFALVVALGPLVVLAVVGALGALAGQRLRSALHLVLLGVLSGAAAMTVVGGWDLGGGLRLLVALTVAVAVGLAYRRWAAVATFLRFASVAPLVLVGVFLFSSPTSTLLGGPDASGAETGDGTDVPVAVLVFDELPTLSLMDGSGGIDAELFPNFARLAESSTWYQDTTTVSPHTRVAVPSMLTGVAPTNTDDGWDPGAGEASHSLFGLLGSSHRVHASEWVTAVCADSPCEAPDTGAEEAPEAAALLPGPLAEGRSSSAVLAEESLRLLWHSAWPLAEPLELQYQAAGAGDAAELARPALEFINSMESSEEPVLDYFHALVPHQPWVLLPSGRHYPEPETQLGMAAEDIGLGFPAPVWGDGPADRVWAEAAHRRHLLQLQWADRMLGAFMDRLEAVGRWDDAVVVVTADHGISFEPGDELRLLRPENQVPVAWVPLFIKAPDRHSGEVSDAPVSLIDVLPTVAELAGVEIGWDIDGVSLASDRPAADRQRWATVEEPDLFDSTGDGDRVALDGDGLAAITSAGPHGSPGDPLRLWRYGPYGDLIGTGVAEGGVCEVGGADVTVERSDVPERWEVGDDGRIEVWVEGRISGDVEAVAVAVDGVVAGTSPVAGPDDTAEEGSFGMLVAEPIITAGEGRAELLVIADSDECMFTRLAED